MHAIARANTHLMRSVFFSALYRLTNVAPIFLVFSVTITATVLSLLFFSIESICVFIAFAYPAYESFKSIRDNDIDEQVQWLSYWIVYAAFHFTHRLTDLLLSRFPYYPAMKIATLAWCFLPQFRGSTIIYKYAVRPVLVLHQTRIDHSLRKVQSHVDVAHQSLADASSSLVPEIATTLTSMATKALIKLEKKRSQNTD